MNNSTFETLLKSKLQMKAAHCNKKEIFLKMY